MKPVIAELPIGSTTALKVRAQRRSQVSNSRRPASSSGSFPIRRSRRASSRGSRSSASRAFTIRQRIVEGGVAQIEGGGTRLVVAGKLRTGRSRASAEDHVGIHAAVYSGVCVRPGRVGLRRSPPVGHLRAASDERSSRTIAVCDAQPTLPTRNALASAIMRDASISASRSIRSASIRCPSARKASSCRVASSSGGCRGSRRARESDRRVGDLREAS